MSRLHTNQSPPFQFWSAARTNDPRVQQMQLVDAPECCTLAMTVGYAGDAVDTEAVPWGAEPQTLPQHNEIVQPPWFAEALEADRRGRESVAIDIVYDNVNQLLKASKFQEVDDLLRTSPIDEQSLTLLIGLLSITLPATPHLPSRVPFYDRVWKSSVAKGRNAEKLLGGLRRWSVMDGTSLRGR